MDSLHECGIKKTNPMHLYLQQLNLTVTVLKVFNLVQNHTGTIPKQYNNFLREILQKRLQMR